ncbi:hypothetical protein VL15_23820 [Burkholderia cepacia]|uniref:Uncharacterized protein n=1 Tax=Burkholderia cepacia TaxID=292 RepID=A0A0J5WPA8_BURCE|nr:hypothetical protein [Burkholderia cepacia]KML53608.1 hypothetical protein VL15_23820 [Burkholderia cepacia]
MMFQRPSSAGMPAEPDADQPLSGIPTTLPDSGVVVNVDGVAYLINLPRRDHARPALWRDLEQWRDGNSNNLAPYRVRKPDTRKD